MYAKDSDDANTVVAEDKAYRDWQREEKNRILSWNNPVKKQTAWSKLFPPFHSDDSWLEEAVIF